MKNYLITDPKYYNSSKESFSNYLKSIYLRHRIDYACFRDKKNDNIEELSDIFLKVSQEFKIEKTFLNTNISLAKKAGFFGVHLNSKQFDKIAYAKKCEKLFVVISTHSKEEAFMGQNEGADAITFSPIFQTPNKGEPKGVGKLADLTSSLEINTFALGGIINEEQILKCKKAGAFGFASIRYFSQ